MSTRLSIVHRLNDFLLDDQMTGKTGHGFVVKGTVKRIGRSLLFSLTGLRCKFTSFTSPKVIRACLLHPIGLNLPSTKHLLRTFFPWKPRNNYLRAIHVISPTVHKLKNNTVVYLSTFLSFCKNLYCET